VSHSGLFLICFLSKSESYILDFPIKSVMQYRIDWFNL